LLDASKRSWIRSSRAPSTNPDALVVSDANDLGAARDLLDRVVTCDRADVPATAKQRELAVGRSVEPQVIEPVGGARRPLGQNRSFGLEI